MRVNIAVENFQKDLSLILCRKILSQLVSEEVSLQGVVKDPSYVPDNTQDIHTKLVTWADAGKADIILTMGGAGLAAKDKGCWQCSV